MKVKVSSILLFLILLYGVNYFVFERELFFNEVLSLAGLVIFIQTSFRRGSKFWLPQSLIYKAVLLFIALGLIHASVGLFIKTNWYYYFRNLSTIYSVFAFFLGFHLYHEQFPFYSRMSKWIYGYGLFAFATGKVGLLDRNSFTFWLALLQRNWRILSTAFLFVMLGLYLLSYTSLTVLIVMGAFIGILFIRRYSSFVLLSTLAFVAFVVLFVAAIPYLRMYSVNREWFFGDVEYVYTLHPLLRVDHNSSWRMIFFYRTVVEGFPQNLLGLGFGTPLLPYRIGVTTTDLGFPDEYIAHVIGAHNSFITVYARMGLFAIIFVGMMYHGVIKEFFTHKRYYMTTRNDGGVFFAFVALTVCAFFNLVIESPTLAGLYWISLGFVARAIYARKFEGNGV